MIPIARPQLGLEEEMAVLEVMRSGALAQGPRVRAFEEAWAAATGARFAVATSNGTTALYLALVAHGIGPGDEVITSALTFIATANAIAQTGARPVLADVDDSLNLDPTAVAALIGPRTKAIVPVHLHGNPCDIASFMGLAQEPRGSRHRHWRLLPRSSALAARLLQPRQPAVPSRRGRLGRDGLDPRAPRGLRRRPRDDRRRAERALAQPRPAPLG